jgi:outer membrane cobalamin receptor
MFVCALYASLFVLFLNASGWSARPLTGTVRDAQTLLPVPHALVELVETGEVVLADPEGRFTFSTLPNGEYGLCVQRIGYARRCDVRVRLGTEEFTAPVVLLVAEPLDARGMTVAGEQEGRPASVIGVHRVITAADIEQTGARTAADALERVPEVEILRNGTQEAQVSIRGSRPDAVKVLVDDVPLNIDGGSVDLASIPAGSIDRIEIVQGPAAAQVGADALAGAVLITTRAAGAKPALAAGAAGGSFDWREGRFRLDGIGLAEHRGWLAWQGMTADGNFGYYDRQFERDTIRENNHSRRQTLTGNGRGPLPGAFRWRAAFSHYQVRAGVPGAEYQLTPEAQRKQKRYIATAGVEGRGLKVDYSLVRDWNYFVNSGVLPYESETEAENQLWRARFAPEAGFVQGISVGAEYVWESLSGIDHRVPAYSFGTARRRNYALALQYTRAFAVGSGALRSASVGAAYRYDRTDTDADYPTTPISPVVAPPQRIWEFGSPYLSLGLGGQASGLGWSTHASYGKAFRRPPLLDQFWEESYRTRGNPALRPERSEQAEIGYSLTLPGKLQLEFQQRFYWSQYVDLILWQIGQGGVWSPANIGRAQVNGRDESLRFSLGGERLRIRVAHLYQDHRNTAGEPNTNGEPLPFRYRHKVTVGAGTNWRWAWLDVAYRWYDRRYLREAGTASKSLDPYGVTDVVAGLRFDFLGLRAQTSLRVENVADSRYEVLERQPMPGRNVLFNLNLNTAIP